MPQQIAIKWRRCPFKQRLKAQNPVWSISSRFVNYVAVDIHLLLQFYSEDRFSRNYAMDAATGPRTFRA